jgi:hypothetical protein
MGCYDKFSKAIIGSGKKRLLTGAKVNEARIAAGKGPVGFINPVLYQHPEVFNDIKNGSNPGCRSEGFHAVDG